MFVHRGHEVAGAGRRPRARRRRGRPTCGSTTRTRSPAAEAAGGSAGPRAVRQPRRRPDGDHRDPAGAVLGVWQPGEHRGAQVVNEPGAWAMSALSTPDPEGAALLRRCSAGRVRGVRPRRRCAALPGFVGGEPQQPVPRDVVAVMVRASRRGGSSTSGSTTSTPRPSARPRSAARCSRRRPTTRWAASAVLADPAGAVSQRQPAGRTRTASHVRQPTSHTRCDGAAPVRRAVAGLQRPSPSTRRDRRVMRSPITRSASSCGVAVVAARRTAPRPAPSCRRARARAGRGRHAAAARSSGACPARGRRGRRRRRSRARSPRGPRSRSTRACPGSADRCRGPGSAGTPPATSRPSGRRRGPTPAATASRRRAAERHLGRAVPGQRAQPRRSVRLDAHLGDRLPARVGDPPLEPGAAQRDELVALVVDADHAGAPARPRPPLARSGRGSSVGEACSS